MTVTNWKGSECDLFQDIIWMEWRKPQ